MATVVNRNTTELLTSINTPDFSVNDWIINPDLSLLDNVPHKYWKIDGDNVVEMNQSEKDAVDFEELSNTILEKKYRVDEYERGKLSVTTWYNVDNEDETYSNKVEETSYTYSGNKIISTTEIQYSAVETVLSEKTWNYYSSGKNIRIAKLLGG